MIGQHSSQSHKMIRTAVAVSRSSCLVVVPSVCGRQGQRNGGRALHFPTREGAASLGPNVASAWICVLPPVVVLCIFSIRSVPEGCGVPRDAALGSKRDVIACQRFHAIMRWSSRLLRLHFRSCSGLVQRLAGVPRTFFHVFETIRCVWLNLIE